MPKPLSEQMFLIWILSSLCIHFLIPSHGQKPLSRSKFWVIISRRHGQSYFLVWTQDTAQCALQKQNSHNIYILCPASSVSALVPFWECFGGCKAYRSPEFVSSYGRVAEPCCDRGVQSPPTGTCKAEQQIHQALLYCLSQALRMLFKACFRCLTSQIQHNMPFLERQFNQIEANHLNLQETINNFQAGPFLGRLLVL